MSDENLERRVTAVEAEVVEVRREAAAARALASGADRDVADYRAEMRAHTRGLEALRQTQIEHYAEHRAEFAEIRAELAEVRGEVAGLGTGLAEVRAEVAGLGTGLAEVKGEVAEVRAEVAEVKVRVGETDATLGRVEGGVQQIIGLLERPPGRPR